METATLKVNGMTCMGCVGSVKRVLQAVEGVTSVEVTLEPGQAKIGYEASMTSTEKLKAVIEDAGYEVV
jgi:copper chaperone